MFEWLEQEPELRKGETLEEAERRIRNVNRIIKLDFILFLVPFVLLAIIAIRLAARSLL